MSGLDILMLPFIIVFWFILFEKWSFFDFWERWIFTFLSERFKIHYSEICFFCWSFWLSLILLVAAYFNGYSFTKNSFFLALTYTTVVSRYLTIQILRK